MSGLVVFIFIFIFFSFSCEGGIISVKKKRHRTQNLARKKKNIAKEKKRENGEKGRKKNPKTPTREYYFHKKVIYPYLVLVSVIALQSSTTSSVFP